MSTQTIRWGCAFLMLGCMTLGSSINAQQAGNPFQAEASEREVLPSKQPKELALSAEDRINATLNQRLKTPLRYEVEQLDIVVENLADEYEIPIVFDKAALDEVAISPETEVSINLQNISLRSALEIMFKEPGLEDLSYVINSEVLLITTEERRNQQMLVKVYPVSDLLDSGLRSFSSSGLNQNYDQLIDVIVACVEYDSWSENGKGGGESQAFSPGMLVVNQTERVHQGVESLIDKLRYTKKQLKTETLSSTEPAQPITCGFAIQLEQGDNPTDVREKLAVAIQKSVDWSYGDTPENGPEKWVEVLPDRVLVRHFPSVVQQVAKVLFDMRVLSASEMAQKSLKLGFGGGGLGGGGGGF